ncbi:MAG: phosphoribosylformylglycinamidine synthase subunit PurQ [bacterium JZ-2024 1]
MVMRKPLFGVVIFPGSNCDRDCFYVLQNVVGVEVEYVWHEERDLRNFQAIILPGGFSYGDYLRAGGIARFSPLMQSIPSFLHSGGLVLGICNGFQILLEAGLLPGAMLKNSSLQFICDWVHLRVENTQTPFTNLFRKGEILTIPIAHYEGNYFADPETLADLEKSRRVVFRYCGPEGEIEPEYNPNGSLNAIAGLVNEEGNVLGMMPHPERASEKILGSEDGLRIFLSMVHFIQKSTSRMQESLAGRG